MKQHIEPNPGVYWLRPWRSSARLEEAREEAKLYLAANPQFQD